MKGFFYVFFLKTNLLFVSFSRALLDFNVCFFFCIAKKIKLNLTNVVIYRLFAAFVDFILEVFTFQLYLR
jgi:hypothetical protein